MVENTRPARWSKPPPRAPNPWKVDHLGEGHSRGMHSVSSVYKIDPEAADFRFCMGVDRRANPIDKTTLGTVQLDLLRVVHQNGFATALLDLQGLVPAQKIQREHLESDH